MISQDIVFFLDVLQKIVTFGIAAWLYLEKKRDTTHAQIAQLADRTDSRLDDHGTRIAGLEARTGPTHSDLTKINDKVSSTKETVSHLVGQLNSINTTLNLLLSRITEKGLQ